MPVRPDSFSDRKKAMVRRLKSAGYIKTAEVERAMEAVPRELFLPADMIDEAYVDSPQPIGRGQTISAPHMVAIMSEELELAPGQKVLEIGGGSGYHAAVTAELVKPDGRVFTIERIPDLVEAARSNLTRAGYSGLVEVVLGDGSKGLPEKAPFDRIFVACGAPDVPSPLVGQLAEKGVMLVPAGSRSCQDLIKVRKRNGRISHESRGGCIFVPLIGEYGYD